MQMTRTPPLLRLYRMEPARRRLLARAAIAVSAASAAVAMLPFRKVLGFGSAPLGRRDGTAPDALVWAVEAAARRLPWRAMCIEKGLATQRMLRRRGIDARLHYGARHSATGKLEAHVWVSVDGETVIGGEEARDFREIAVFP